MLCQSCGSQNHADSERCEVCGAPLQLQRAWMEESVAEETKVLEEEELSPQLRRRLEEFAVPEEFCPVAIHLHGTNYPLREIACLRVMMDEGLIYPEAPVYHLETGDWFEAEACPGLPPASRSFPDEPTPVSEKEPSAATTPVPRSDSNLVLAAKLGNEAEEVAAQGEYNQAIDLYHEVLALNPQYPLAKKRIRQLERMRKQEQAAKGETDHLRESLAKDEAEGKVAAPMVSLAQLVEIEKSTKKGEERELGLSSHPQLQGRSEHLLRNQAIRKKNRFEEATKSRSRMKQSSMIPEEDGREPFANDSTIFTSESSGPTMPSSDGLEPIKPTEQPPDLEEWDHSSEGTALLGPEDLLEEFEEEDEEEVSNDQHGLDRLLAQKLNALEEEKASGASTSQTRAPRASRAYAFASEEEETVLRLPTPPPSLQEPISPVTPPTPLPDASQHSRTPVAALTPPPGPTTPIPSVSDTSESDFGFRDDDDFYDDDDYDDEEAATLFMEFQPATESTMDWSDSELEAVEPVTQLASSQEFSSLEASSAPRSASEKPEKPVGEDTFHGEEWPLSSQEFERLQREQEQGLPEPGAPLHGPLLGVERRRSTPSESRSFVRSPVQAQSEEPSLPSQQASLRSPASPVPRSIEESSSALPASDFEELHGELMLPMETSVGQENPLTQRGKTTPPPSRKPTPSLRASASAASMPSVVSPPSTPPSSPPPASLPATGAPIAPLPVDSSERLSDAPFASLFAQEDEMKRRIAERRAQQKGRESLALPPLGAAFQESNARSLELPGPSASLGVEDLESKKTLKTNPPGLKRPSTLSSLTEAPPSQPPSTKAPASRPPASERPDASRIRSPLPGETSSQVPASRRPKTHPPKSKITPVQGRKEWLSLSLPKPVKDVWCSGEWMCTLSESGTEVTVYQLDKKIRVASRVLKQTCSQLVGYNNRLVLLHPEAETLTFWSLPKLIPVGKTKVGKSPTDMVAFGNGSVLVANSGSGSLSLLEPKDKRYKHKRIPIGGSPFRLSRQGEFWVILHKKDARMSLWRNP